MGDLPGDPAVVPLPLAELPARIVDELKRGGPRSRSELSGCINRDPETIDKALRELERDGVVSRGRWGRWALRQTNT